MTRRTVVPYTAPAAHVRSMGPYRTAGALSSCTLGVVGPTGKRLGHQAVEANAQALVAAIRAVPGTRHLCLEEGTLSGWLYEVLSPHVHELVVHRPNIFLTSS